MKTKTEELSFISTWLIVFVFLILLYSALKLLGWHSGSWGDVFSRASTVLIAAMVIRGIRLFIKLFRGEL